MKKDIPIKNSITIPDHEIEITTSRSSGAGGQHVNKTNTRITLRWNARNTSALSDEQKERVLQKLNARLTTEGDLLIHSSESRSLEHNKKMALKQLHHIVQKALHVAKKRIATKLSRTKKQARLQAKKQHSLIKKMRSKSFED